jgi:DNA primase
MVNQLLISLTDSVLGKGHSTARNNQAYKCPFCNHHKQKLEVNFTENNKGENPWHCWVCNKKGKKLATLFKQVEAPYEKLVELSSLVKSNIPLGEITAEIKNINLPKEFKPLSQITSGDITGKHALKYLKSRGLTKEDILRYNIGYCDEGRYVNMVIIPSYDETGKLNYFVSRSFISSSKLNPSISKDIIGFEFFVNWHSPIVLCEGAFDAISIKRNAIPLFGKIISKTLMKKLVTSAVDKVYIALDKDAIKDALEHCKILMDFGKKVYLVEMQDKDPNELGFNQFTNIIQQTPALTYDMLMKKKIML